MDCIIDVKVRGNHLSKDNRNAGVQHEANVTFLRIDFDEGWDGYAKTVTFWDALMGNPTKVVLTTDKLVDIVASPRTYQIPIPGEALTEAGYPTFVIDGFVDGKRKRSLADTLWVKEAPYDEDAGEPTDPTPSQAEQLQQQVDQIIDTIQDAVQAKADAQSSADFALLQARTAGEHAQDAMNQAIAAGNHRRAAESAQTAAESSAAAAARSAEDARQAAGGEYATPEQAQGYVSAHNTDTTAHADMRSELTAVARAKPGGEIDQRLQNRVEKSGDTMTGILTFDTPTLFSAFQKKRTINGTNYIMRAGIGNDGSGASLCMRLFSVAADGTETVVSHIEADSSGVYWVSPGGIRKTIAHSGNIGLLTASVE